SSRRRHTRCLSDWSSDVCSSDLGRVYHDLGRCRKELGDRAGAEEAYRKAVEFAPFRFEPRRDLAELLLGDGRNEEAADQLRKARSEERRVGKEWRRWGGRRCSRG